MTAAKTESKKKPPVKKKEEPEASPIDEVDSGPTTVELEDGTIIVLKRMKTRQFFRLLRIVTHGMGGMLGSLFEGDVSEVDPEEFVTQFAAALLFAIPEAEDETMQFIYSMIEMPLDEIESTRVQDLLIDPEIEDTIMIIEGIIRQERGDLAALGKRLQKMFKVAEKTGQT